MSLGTMARHDLVVAKQIQQIHKFTGMAIGGDLCENCAYTLWRQGGRAPTRRRRGLVAGLSYKRDDLATLPRSFGRSQDVFFWGRLRDLNVGQPVSQSNTQPTQATKSLVLPLVPAARVLWVSDAQCITKASPVSGERG